jgi:hypothetical protein
MDAKIAYDGNSHEEGVIVKIQDAKKRTDAKDILLSYECAKFCRICPFPGAKCVKVK